MAAATTGDLRRELRSEVKESIAERLSSLENLYFPRALHSSAADPSQRKSIFLDLLSRDVAVFLERYGSQLTGEELREFDGLKDDYEVNWHLNHLRSIKSPTSTELRSRSIMVKNRRRAYLDKLMHDGQYFSEDAMREREPYLHHEYLGRFQDPSSRSMARPGERWSETLIRRSEEAYLVSEIRREQQRLGVAERDWVGNERRQEPEDMEEEEEEEEEDEDEDEEHKAMVAEKGEQDLKVNGASHAEVRFGEVMVAEKSEQSVKVNEASHAEVRFGEVMVSEKSEQSVKMNEASHAEVRFGEVMVSEKSEQSVKVNEASHAEVRFGEVMVSEKSEQSVKVNEASHAELTSRGNNGSTSTTIALSDVEMQDQMDQFMYVMQQKFLTGEDHQHLDYSKIDDDETLDDHWLREASHDAEEKYFDDD